MDGGGGERAWNLPTSCAGQYLVCLYSFWGLLPEKVRSEIGYKLFALHSLLRVRCLFYGCKCACVYACVKIFILQTKAKRAQAFNERLPCVDLLACGSLRTIDEEKSSAL